MGTKISELTAAGAIDGTEQIPIVQGGTTKRTTIGDIGADMRLGIGDTIRGYNTSGTNQTLPIDTFPKITIIDKIVNPTNGWSIANYGDNSGGTTFVWDFPNDRVEVLRNCLVAAVISVTCTAIDVAAVVQATGKVNTTQPTIAPVLRATSAPSRNGAIHRPAIPSVEMGFYDGGGVLEPIPFPVIAGDFIELFVGAIGSELILTSVDLTLRNIGNMV